MSSSRARASARPSSGRRLGPFRLIGVLVGLVLVGIGLALIVPPLWALWQRNRVDSDALNQWNGGGSQALVGGGAANYAGKCGTGDAATNYARVSFPSLAQYGYAGVAGDGSWDLLLHRSMVHYQGTAAPGQKGNDIIAFHREPEYEHIDQLNVGDIVDVQDRSCKTWAYRITGRWQLAPSRVTQLSTTDGHDLTLITCTPFWQDTQRLVWRATLVTGAGAQSAIP